MGATRGVHCESCSHVFDPEDGSAGGWLCPNCHTRNPNLRRHYRAIAGLCVLGFLVTVVALIVPLSGSGSIFLLAFGFVLAGVFLVTGVIVYRVQSPWSDPLVRSFLWTVFSVGLVLTIVIPLAVLGILTCSPIILGIVVFPYLFWVDGHARRARVAASGEP